MRKSKTPRLADSSDTPHVDETAFTGGFTLRDEANALTAFAFRNGFLEDLHAGETSSLLGDPTLSRLSNDEMRKLMIEASQKLAHLLQLRETDPERYQQLVRVYAAAYCIGWER